MLKLSSLPAIGCSPEDKRRLDFDKIGKALLTISGHLSAMKRKCITALTAH